MSTELKDHDEDYGPHKLRAFGGTVQFEFVGGDDLDSDTADMEIKDFIAAVETELNGIFISRDELPEVEDGSTGRIIAGVIEISRTSDPAALRAEGLRYLAAAGYVEAHPPVDPQVEALEALIGEVSGSRGPTLARLLIATGKVTVSTE